MPTFKRSSLESTIRDMKCQRVELEWLMKLNVPGKRVVDFGCADGSETFALMWMLRATEAIGIDSDIHRAERRLQEIRQAVAESLVTLQTYVSGSYPGTVTDEDRSWWKGEVPDFLKEKRFPAFRKADMTNPTDLQWLFSERFDLAYCCFVLYHIRDDGEHRVKSAIEQMARVVRSGGWVVAVEPVKDPDSTRLDFRGLFESSELDQVPTTIDDSAVFEQADLIPPVDRDSTIPDVDCGRYPYLYKKR